MPAPEQPSFAGGAASAPPVAKGPDGPTRRRFLAGAGLVGGGIVVGTARDLLLAPAGAAAPKPSINPRSAWGGDLPPKGPLEPERDVKFLLVHHTAGANGYPADAVRSTLRGIYSYHTGPKGWKDVAYNFFVDAHGGIWEGRKGSLDGPVRGDATGGSQGFAQLCCFLGDHQVTPPSAAAQAAMTDLLAWLAGRDGIDLRSGATVSFTSRGSNLHPVGSRVTTPTIAAHRDMSKTTCPGDACYQLVKGPIAQIAAAKAGATSAAATTTVATSAPASTPPGVTPMEPAAPETSLPAASATQVGEDDLAPPLTGAPPAPVEVARAPRQPAGEPSSTGRLLGVAGLGAVGAVAGAVLFRRRRHHAAAESRWYAGELLNPPGGGSAPPPDPAPDPRQEPAAPSEDTPSSP